MADFRGWYHVETVEQALEVINKLQWNMTIEKWDQRWVILTGDQEVFSADSYAAVDAFL